MILGLDFGQTTGWAIGAGDGVIRSGVFELDSDPAKAYRSLQLAMVTVRGWSYGIDLIAYESVPASVHRGGTAAHRWGGYEAIILAYCVQHGMPYLGVPIQTWKRAAGVRSASGPDEALQAARARWPGVEFATADEAVARWVAVAAHRMTAEHAATCGRQAT